MGNEGIAGLAYYLPALDRTVGDDLGGSLQRTWEEFAAATRTVPHRCNGVTRWTAGGRTIQRIVYFDGSGFRFEDEDL